MKHHVKRARLVSAMVVIGLSTAIAACGTGSTSAENPAAEGELTAVRIGVLPNVDVAPLYLGDQEGFFAEAGLDLELVPAQGGAAVVPAVVSGDFDFGFSNTASLLTATGKGLSLTIVAPGASSTGESGNDIAATVVPPGSSISSLEDLAGKTVATTSLGGTYTLTLRHLLEKNGADGTKVNFVELPAAETPAALLNGDVDAAVLGEPFLSHVLAGGGIVVASNFADTYEDLMVAGYFTTKEYAQANSETVNAFRSAMQESIEYASQSPDAVREVLSAYTELSEEDRNRMVLPRFNSDISIESLEVMADLLVKDGQLEAKPDVQSLIYQ